MIYFVFDVESIGLHGEAFAVGYVVKDSAGATLEERLFACDPLAARGTRFSHDWIAGAIPKLPITHTSPAGLRSIFWHTWLGWRDLGATLWADCAWPVEARFLIKCIEDDHAAREWAGPYPLYDIATLQFSAGIDPLTTHGRKGDEPEHNPLGDARQSARILFDCLEIMKRR